MAKFRIIDYYKLLDKNVGSVTIYDKNGEYCGSSHASFGLINEYKNCVITSLHGSSLTINEERHEEYYKTEREKYASYFINKLFTKPNYAKNFLRNRKKWILVHCLEKIGITAKKNLTQEQIINKYYKELTKFYVEDEPEFIACYLPEDVGYVPNSYLKEHNL